MESIIIGINGISPKRRKFFINKLLTFNLLNYGRYIMECYGN